MTGAPWLRLVQHRATTAQLCALYPFHAGGGLGAQGVYLGTDLLAGGAGFAFDPFLAYQDHQLTNANMVIAGDLGNGKSATVKAFLYRSVGVFGRWCAVIDPKGEYQPLAQALGLTVINLHPGGSTRLNPLHQPAGTTGEEVARRRHAMTAALLGAVLDRDLTPIEDAALAWALDLLIDDEPTLIDLRRLLTDPPAALARQAHTTPRKLAERVEAIAFALGKLIDRDLRGMFDGPSTVDLPADGRGVVIDVSAVHHDPQALRLVMVAATGWLQSVLATPTRRRIQVLDEAWALLADARTARYMQSCWKLGRALGVANIAVIHRFSDLRAQADDGTTTAKVAAGLLADTQTRVVFRQAHDQIPDAQALLGLTDTEAQLLDRLIPHRALWKLGRRTAVVHHALSSRELELCDTDGAMI